MAHHKLSRVCLLDAALLLNAAERYMRLSGSPLYGSIRTMADALDALAGTKHIVPRQGHLTWSALSIELRKWMNDSLGDNKSITDWLVDHHNDFFIERVTQHGISGFRELYDSKWLKSMAQQLKEEYAGRAGFKPAATPVKQDRQAIDRTPRPKIEKTRPIMHKFYGQN